MRSRFILIFWGIALLTAALSIFTHYQRPKTLQLQAPNLSAEELIKPKTIWKASLSKLAQFEKPRAIPSIENNPIIGIESGRLVGIIIDTPKRAIVIHPESGKVLEIGLGEGWLPGWTLIETRVNHVIWQKEPIQEQYKQMLFIRQNDSEFPKS
ncbi:MAG: hypothetical protein CL828_06110 [Crocinitomicaceae bacterium]|nr:hypothetical protein [Crocinitomicaceae bacterium]